MTVRLCLIGNSHLAALALGWREIAPRYPDIAITFFGARASCMDGLRVSERGLRPDTPALAAMLRQLSGGPDEIVADDYDIFWFAGHEFGLDPILDIYSGCWAEAHTPDADRMPVSDQLFAELCVAALRRTMSMELYRRLRQVSDAPVAMLRQPAPSFRAFKTKDARYAPYRLAGRKGDRASLGRQADSAFARIAREEGFKILRQPGETCITALHTLATFARGSVRLDDGLTGAHGPNDAMHMNAEFGALMLDAHLPALVNAA